MSYDSRAALREVQKIPRVPQLAGLGQRPFRDEVLQVGIASKERGRRCAS
jgi:hypothetical protein